MLLAGQSAGSAGTTHILTQFPTVWRQWKGGRRVHVRAASVRQERFKPPTSLNGKTLAHTGIL
jgi:hypothetical protein